MSNIKSLTNKDLIGNHEALQNAISDIRTEVYKDYYKDLHTYQVKNLECDRSPGESLRFLKLTKLTYTENEDLLQKLSIIYNSSVTDNSSLVILINSNEDKENEFFIGIASNNRNINKDIKPLENNLKSFFQGTSFTKEIENKYIDDILFNADLLPNDNDIYLSSVSTLASIQDKSKTEKKEFLQGIEKFIDTMQGKAYSAIFIAEKINIDSIFKMETQYQNWITALSQFKKFSFTQNTSKTNSDFTSTSLSTSLSIGTPEIIIGGSVGVSQTSGSSIAYGSGEAFQVEIEDKNIIDISNNIDNQLKRFSEAKDYGLYACGIYFLSEDKISVELAARSYNSLLKGDGVSYESSAINIWSGVDTGDDFEERKKIEQIKEYLSRGKNPIFQKGTDERSAATYVTGLQLPLHMGLPHRSVSGLSVIEHASFGRNIITTNLPAENERTITLGKLYHMGCTENKDIALSINELTKHTFVTGSTGSGKSNTVYKMLDEASNNNVKFMVIEPAKGEYKSAFHDREDVQIYGTNPYKVPNLLKINPFTFPSDIHVLEHIDRLVEIFNACWPMYAAMPAVLKETIEKAYESCGWNLRTSKNIENIYPDFNTVLELLPIVIDSSGYSNDTSSDYKGALITRVRSLTNGFYGMIFSGDIDSNELFNENTIIDLSRVAAQETKALIMGILILKLQEFRMSETVINSELRHITVLEEAHNLLKRTSSEQSQEGSNLQGKSVEMLSNSIAEMRTYGEGFIIADQSPGLLDMSVIRNTNTKIILRLPDQGDRELVGRAAGLNDRQIEELAKLEQGVAAMSQANWLEPILCKVNKFDFPVETKDWNFPWSDTRDDIIKQFLLNAFDIERRDLYNEDIDSLKNWISSLSLNEKKKEVFNYVLENRELNDSGKMTIIYGVCKHTGFMIREQLIINTKNKFKTYGFTDTDNIINTCIEQLFINNITDNGERIINDKVK